jgi:hypothetical protein
MTSSNVTEHLAEHTAIRHLLDAYTDYTNEREWANLGALLAEKVLWRVVGGHDIPYVIEGRDAVIETVRRRVEETPVLVQMIHASNISVSGRRATARSTMEAVSSDPDGVRRAVYAVYHDEIGLEDDGEWRFLSREFRVKETFVLPPA